MLIDSHAHIYDEMFDAEGGAESIVSRMDSDNLEYIVCVGCDMPSSRTSVALADKHERVYATVGVHPYDAHTVTKENLEVLAELAAHKKVVAIGEIGLDFHRDGSDRQLQVKAMCAQYDLARQIELPTMYHIRDGFGEFCEFIKTRDFPEGGVLHCFSGSRELAEQFVKKGFYVSFSGTVTYRNAVNLWRAAEVVPIDRLMIETDSPYLTPSALRGQINHPANVKYVAQKLAELKGVSADEIERITTENTKRIYGIK